MYLNFLYVSHLTSSSFFQCHVECLKINESNYRNRFFEEFGVVFDLLDTFILSQIDRRVHFP